MRGSSQGGGPCWVWCSLLGVGLRRSHMVTWSRVATISSSCAWATAMSAEVHGLQCAMCFLHMRSALSHVPCELDTFLSPAFVPWQQLVSSCRAQAMGDLECYRPLSCSRGVPAGTQQLGNEGRSNLTVFRLLEEVDMPSSRIDNNIGRWLHASANQEVAGVSMVHPGTGNSAFSQSVRDEVVTTTSDAQLDVLQSAQSAARPPPVIASVALPALTPARFEKTDSSDTPHQDISAVRRAGDTCCHPCCRLPVDA